MRLRKSFVDQMRNVELFLLFCILRINSPVLILYGLLQAGL